MQKALTEKDVFRFIKLEATHFWDQLLWMDAINYGGVTAGADVAKFLRRAAAVEREHEFDDEVAEESADAEEAPPFEMSWNIQRFLPPFLQDSFTELIAEFLLKLHHLKQQRRDGVKPGDTPVRGIPTNMTASQVRDTDAVVNGERRLVKEYFTRKLLELIPQVQRAASSVFSTEEERWNVAFPQLPGSHLKLDNAALELIKMICKVFGLAKDLENEVRVMRRTLLNLISVREFCAEAEFHNPCESFILPHVICSFCQHCRDLDLSMDDVGGVEDGGDVGGAGGRGTAGWLCPRCHNEYDNALLEELLVEMLQRNLLSYQLQDLVCAKCKTIKEENVREHCRQCANPFTLQTKGKLSSATVFRRKLTTLGNVAAMYRMPFLGEAVAFYAERC